jgi:hypothetical protein
MAGNPQPQPVAPRFWSKVDRRGNNECWQWTGCRNRDGYGNLSVNGAMKLATHVALELSGKARPSNACALHSCDTPLCVNPHHLRWGSHAENMADMAAKGRSGNHSGTANGRAKVRPDQVAAIRASSKQLKELAAIYSVGLSTISRIRRGENWKDA